MNRRNRATPRWAFALILCAACEPPPPEVPQACQIVRANIPLSRDVRETSGLVLSRQSPGLFWTHNDSGNEPHLFLLDSAGTLRGRVRVIGIEPRDWEDLATGPCDAGTCLFIGDIGDNPERRDSISIYVVPEPVPTDSVTTAVTRYNVRYPDRAQDAEAMFVVPTGDIYLVTKGRRDSVALYRLPKHAQVPDTLVTLEKVRSLWPRPSRGFDRVTGATTSRDGARVAIRSYGAIYLFATDSLLRNGAPLVTYDLRPLRERQGEGIALGDNGQVWLTSEGKGGGAVPALSQLTCALPAT